VSASQKRLGGRSLRRTADSCLLLNGCSGCHHVCTASWASPSFPLGLQLARPSRHKVLCPSAAWASRGGRWCGREAAWLAGALRRGGGRAGKAWSTGAEHQRGWSPFGTPALPWCSLPPGLRHSPSEGSLASSPPSCFCCPLLCAGGLRKASAWGFFHAAVAEVACWVRLVGGLASAPRQTSRGGGCWAARRRAGLRALVALRATQWRPPNLCTQGRDCCPGSGGLRSSQCHPVGAGAGRLGGQSQAAPCCCLEWKC